MLSNSTAGKCAPMQTMKQPVTFGSFDQREALKMLLLSEKTMADYIYGSFYFVVSLHGVKTYGINGKEAQTGDWE